VAIRDTCGPAAVCGPMVDNTILTSCYLTALALCSCCHFGSHLCNAHSVNIFRKRLSQAQFKIRINHNGEKVGQQCTGSRTKLFNIHTPTKKCKRVAVRAACNMPTRIYVGLPRNFMNHTDLDVLLLQMCMCCCTDSIITGTTVSTAIKELPCTSLNKLIQELYVHP
jgi:hypothetical protein